ncbi:TMV resistance protein N-like [Malus sylvestris]|uniref:TMV resistance protein N-like n=1 Tax=Malus sylvestris TaxID=3752 RepID=UPI0021ACC6CF|nr:TMV resistance protein N-like [Malus sylvestris]
MDTSSSAHGAGSAASSSSSQSSNRWKYEVFLSFRGEDTRNTFTDHLFIALRNAGINTFIDNQLTRGENIQSELDQEIEGSRIAVIVFSKEYAESRWCLRELSKIMRCLKDQEGKIVCPIFYDVDPSQVRKQEDSFGEAFQKHETAEDPNEVKQWREDLKASADLGGWNLKTTADGREGVFIEKIIGDIKGLLKPTDLKEAKHSVGIAFRVQEFNTKYLDVVGSPDVQIIGIWGTGGIGKTTLAKEICSKYGHSFSSQCYLEEVRSNKKNMVSLQEQLLRDILKRSDIKVSNVAEGTKEIEKRLGSMKVLVVVDDIDDADQLDKLAITHVSFGPGSRIIITTRDEQVLNIQKVDKRYKAQGMTDDEAFELLSWHAFGNRRPDEEYIELARDVVNYCGGLPLALEVVGRLLATKKSKSIWKSTLDKLRNIPDGKIHETLKLSYDGLRDDHVKGVFLDISCFFLGWGKPFVTAILDGCSRFSVEAEITTLCERCLLYIDEEKKLRMHDLIRDMGREILRAESSVELGKRSRLWHSEDAKSVLRNELGTEAVEGLTLFLPEDSDDEQSFSTEAFKKMWRLKFLKLENVKLTGSYKHLSKELILLYWDGFPLEAIPADFGQRNLVYMELSNSKIVRVWEDSNLLPKKLKYLILRGCHDLTKLPDFSKLPLLEVLNLSGCKGLCGGYHFLAQLKMIQALNLSNCNITDGAVLQIIGSLSSLRVLYLGGNGFNKLPILSGLSQLQLLCLNHCTNLQAIPDLPNSLIELEANNCIALEIMSDFSEMSKMRKLELKECRKLKDIPNLENSLDYMVSIHMEGCTSLTGTFKENLQTKNAFGGIFLSGNDIPNRLAYVAREDEILQFVVPGSIDYIRGLALGIVYSSNNDDSTGFLYIDVVNLTQRTKFCVWAMKATVTASHEDYLWLGNLSNKKLNLKGGDMVVVRANFQGGDKRIKVNKTGVDIVKWDLSDSGTNWDAYETMSYKSFEDTLLSFPQKKETLLSYRHVFLCYKTPKAWPWRNKGTEFDPLIRFFASAFNARKNDITVKTLLTVIEGHEGTEFSDGDVLIFPQMIKYRGLKESDVDSFVDDVIVNDKPWASGVQEPLIGPRVFICAHMCEHPFYRLAASILIDDFKRETKLRGLTDQVFVTACFQIEGQKYARELRIYSPDSDGRMIYHWYPFVTFSAVSQLLDKHIGKGEIIERHWRGASSDKAEEINDRELPNGEENKKIEEKPQENGNQIHQEKGNQIENNENFSGYCQGANSDGFTCCEEVSLEENGGSEEKKPKETRESCARKDGLRKLSSLIGNWEQSDVLAATVVVGAVATVVVAYNFYKRSG